MIIIYIFEIDISRVGAPQEFMNLEQIRLGWDKLFFVTWPELPVWENESENYTRNGDLKMTWKGKNY